MRVGTVSLVAGLFVILAAPYVSAQEYPVGAEVAEPVVVEAPEAAEGPVVAEDLVTADIPKRATQDTTDERDSICIRDKMNEIWRVRVCDWATTCSTSRHIPVFKHGWVGLLMIPAFPRGPYAGVWL